MNVSPVDRVIAVRMVRIATVSMSRPDMRRFVAQRHRIAPYDQVRAVITAAVTSSSTMASAFRTNHRVGSAPSAAASAEVRKCSELAKQSGAS